MKKIIRLILTIVLILVFRVEVNATNFVTNDYIKNIDTSKIDEELSKNIYIDCSAGDLLKDIAEGKKINIEFQKEITETISIEMKKNLIFISKMIILIVMVAILNVIIESFKDKNISKIAYFSLYIVMISTLYYNFKDIADLLASTIESLNKVINISIPTFTALLIGSGKIKTAMYFEPLSFVLTNVISLFVRKYLPAIIMLLGTLILIDNISEKQTFSNLIELSKKVIIFIFKSLIYTTFCLGGINKLTSGVMDNITKDIVNGSLESMLPIFGDATKSSINVMINCVNIAKNSYGIVILIAILLIVLKIVIKLIVAYIAYQCLVIGFEGILDKRIQSTIKELSNLYLLSTNIIVFIVVIYMIDIIMILV